MDIHLFLVFTYSNMEGQMISQRRVKITLGRKELASVVGFLLHCHLGTSSHRNAAKATSIICIAISNSNLNSVSHQTCYQNTDRNLRTALATLLSIHIFMHRPKNPESNLKSFISRSCSWNPVVPRHLASFGKPSQTSKPWIIPHPAVL